MSNYENIFDELDRIENLSPARKAAEALMGNPHVNMDFHPPVEPAPQDNGGACIVAATVIHDGRPVDVVIVVEESEQDHTHVPGQVKWNGGNPVRLCATCRTILGPANDG